MSSDDVYYSFKKCTTQCLLTCKPEYAYGAAGAPPLVPPAATIDFDLELVALRDLQTSHNPEEVDLAERYREILDAQEARGNAERRAPEEEADEEEELMTRGGEWMRHHPPGIHARPRPHD